MVYTFIMNARTRDVMPSLKSAPAHAEEDVRQTIRPRTAPHAEAP